MPVGERAFWSAIIRRVSPRRLPALILGLLLGLAACAAPGGGATPGILLPPVSSTPAPSPTALPGLMTATPAASATLPAGLTEATATPLLEAATSTSTPTAAGPCTNNAHFLADVTVPDGAQFQPGQPIDKQWQVRNTGTCEWGPDYRLVLVSGNALSARGEAALYPAKPGITAIFELAMLAPQEPGKYTGRWQARDPSGKLFGDRIFITIEVVGPPATETATPAP